MQKVSYIPWLRIGAESVAIVSSILLAFGIDAWYDGVIEQARADNYESRIEIELTEIRAQLSFLQRAANRAQEYAVQLAPFFEASRQWPDQESLVVALYNVGRDYGVPLDTSNYDDLVATGGLGLLSNVDRRVAIQRAYAYVDAVQDARDPSRDDYLTGVRGWIPQHVIDQIRVVCPGIADDDWDCAGTDIDDEVAASIVRDVSTREARLAFQLRQQGLVAFSRTIGWALEEVDAALAELR